MTHRRPGVRAGSSAVELSIVLPFLAFLFVITADFGRVFYYSQTIENCARKGAIYGADLQAAAQSPYTSLQQAALADASSLNPQPTVTSTNTNDSSGNPCVQVTVAWTFKTVTAFPGIPNAVNLSRTVQMRVVQ
ncbi:MAG TPA: TadE/TadG family type IV pilus assembly protein [Pirellulales bacterium]|jgi:Flp pilus assembly protein TadG|nr:TadE/TadG family type IV pilus assembly protein [Pirellulales bacterium]